MWWRRRWGRRGDQGAEWRQGETVKKNNRTPLTLRAETVRHLISGQLNLVHGGVKAVTNTDEMGGCRCPTQDPCFPPPPPFEKA